MEMSHPFKIAAIAFAFFFSICVMIYIDMLSHKNWQTDVSKKVGRKKDITRGTVLAGAASYDRGREVGGSKHDLLQTSLHGEYHDDRYHHCHRHHPSCQL